MAFSVVGAFGFAVDAALFALLNAHYGWSIVAARTLSASCSIATTWAFNRALTFATRKSANAAGELARYAAGQIVGVLVNVGVFAACVSFVPALRRTPLVALAIGAACALAFNFWSARTLAFRGAPRR